MTRLVTATLMLAAVSPIASGRDEPKGPDAAWRAWVASAEGSRAAEAVRRLPAATSRKFPQGLNDREFVRELAKRAWRCLQDVQDVRCGLPLDRIDLAPRPRVQRRTSTSNTGLYLACIVAAHELGFLDKQSARALIRGVLDVIEELKAWRGLPFEWFSTATLEPAPPRRASTVASAWLCAGLMVAHDLLDDEGKRRCRRFVSRMDFGALYDEGVGLFYGHFDADGQGFARYHNGCFATETRMASYVAIAMGQVPPNHIFRPWRVMPKARKPDSGVQRTYLGVDVWEQSLLFRGVRLGARSWGGSMFEALMPALFVDEAALAPRSLGRNDRATVLAHIAFARAAGYPVWGFSPCAVPGGERGGYGAFGVPQIGSTGSYGTDVVAPYAGALALGFAPDVAVANLRRLLARFPDLSGPYGPHDAVNVETKQVCRAYLALDQEMILLAAANFLRDGCVQKAFHRFPYVADRLEPVLGIEEFEFGDE